MANELNFYGDLTQTGLTVIARVYDPAGVVVGTDISCSEAGTLSIYTGDMPTATIGQYGIRFFDSSDDSLLSQGFINWDGTQEIEFNLDVAVSTRSSHVSPDLSALQTTADADTKQSELITEINANEAKIDLIPTTSSGYDDTILIGKIDVIDSNVDGIKATTDTLVNADLSALETKAQADARQALLIAEHDQTQTDISNINFSDTAILAAIAALNDISTTDIRTELATELARLDANVSSVSYDDTALTSLVNALPTLVEMEASTALTAIADITGLSTHDAAAVVTAMQVVADDFKADVSGISFDDTAILNAIAALNDIDLTTIEGSSVLAKEATLNSIITSISAIPTTDSVADLTPVLAAISNLNDATVAQIVSGLQAVAGDFQDKNVEAEIHAWLDTYANKDDWKGSGSVDLTPIQTVVDAILIDTDELQQNQIDISGLSTFDPSIDQVVASNMRGTDNANTVVPPTTVEIEAALLNEGDGQQLIDAIVQAIGNTNVSEVALIAAIRADLERNGGLLDNLPTLTEIEASNILAKTADVTGLTIPQLSDILTTIKPDLTIINEGVKNSSLIIPHSQDLT